jgi:NAD(P)-dependent dehydrogenase (short-subunit alcohol dehydrogenase family)
MSNPAPAPVIVAPVVRNTNKTVLITGANRGLGLALAQAFAATPGWSVIGTARNIDTLPKELRMAYALDLNHASHIDNLVHLLSQYQMQQQAAGAAPFAIDVVIHNAGFNPKDLKDNSGYFESTFYVKQFSAANVAESCRINALHPMELTGKLLAVPNLMSDTAMVIGISSWLGSITDKDFAGHYGYAGSKALFNMCLKGLALEMAKDAEQPHRCAIALNPGWMATDMGGPNAERTPDQVAKAILDMVCEEGYLRSQNGKFLNIDRTEHAW